ncbi:MAG: WG repeat-containing protein [Chitinophagales bacterium]
MRKLYYSVLLTILAGSMRSQQSIVKESVLIKFTQDYKVGYKNERGVVIVPNKYTAGSDFENGFAIILAGDKRGYLDKYGNEAIPPQYQDASPFYYGLACVKKDGLYGYINPQNEWVIKNTFQNAFSFYEGVARVMVNNKWGLINLKGEFILQSEYVDIKDCAYGLILARKDKLYGYLKSNGSWAIPPQYEQAMSFVFDGTAEVVSHGKTYLINQKNEILREINHAEEHEEDEKKSKAGLK